MLKRLNYANCFVNIEEYLIYKILNVQEELLHRTLDDSEVFRGLVPRD